MKFLISDEIIKKYRGVEIGLLCAKDIKVEESNFKIESFIQNVENQILSDFTDNSLENIHAITIWREIYQSFGASHKKLSSVEALINGILETNKIHRINSIVDLYNGISAKYLLPMAAYDLDKITGDIELRYSKKGEKFTPLALNQIEKTKSGEVIYADAEKVICRRWNNKDCDETKITSNSSNILFFIDGAPSIAEGTVKMALDELATHIYNVFNVPVEKAIVCPESDISSWEIF